MTLNFLQPLICNNPDSTSQWMDVCWRTVSDTLLSEFILFCSGEALWIKVAPGTKKRLTNRTRQYSKAALPETVLPAKLIYSVLTWMTGEYSTACSDKVRRPMFNCLGVDALLFILSDLAYLKLVLPSLVPKHTCDKGIDIFWFVTPD